MTGVGPGGRVDQTEDQGTQRSPKEQEDKRLSLKEVREACDRIRARMRYAVRGRDEVIDLILIAVLSEGHVLLEDHPGSGKTTLAKALGSSLFERLPYDYRDEDSVLEAAKLAVFYGFQNDDQEVSDFRRIQFTPDLLPGDILGASIFNTTSRKFEFKPGPIFAHVVLGDEINRTSPKVQSALLEAMAEKQITIDSKTYYLGDFFFVIATQNPQDNVGTYPLPIAQLDRFLFKIKMNPIAREDEIEVLVSLQDREAPLDEDNFPRVSRTTLIAARRALKELVYVDPRIYDTLVDIAILLRNHEGVYQGVSTRSLVMMVPALRALAALRERDFVTEQDIKTLAPYIFAHRLRLKGSHWDPVVLVEECLKKPLEKLSQVELREN